MSKRNMTTHDEYSKISFFHFFLLFLSFILFLVYFFLITPFTIFTLPASFCTFLFLFFLFYPFQLMHCVFFSFHFHVCLPCYSLPEKLILPARSKFYFIIIFSLFYFASFFLSIVSSFLFLFFCLQCSHRKKWWFRRCHLFAKLSPPFIVSFLTNLEDYFYAIQKILTNFIFSIISGQPFDLREFYDGWWRVVDEEEQGWWMLRV